MFQKTSISIRRSSGLICRFKIIERLKISFTILNRSEATVDWKALNLHMFPFFASRFANQEIRVTIALQCSWRHWRLHYLNNRVFLSRNYRLIFAPRKFDVFNFLSCAPLNFLLHASSKMISNYFQLIKLKSWQPNVKYEKEDCQNLIQFQLFIFDMPACL